MMRMALLLAVTFIGGCASTPAGATMGPTGNRSDVQNLTPVKVLDTWKVDVLPQSQSVVQPKLRFAKKAVFDEKVGYEGYYDRIRDVTWVAVWGNVTSTGDAGQVDQNGYYVVWEQHGRNVADFPPPWSLASVDVFDHTF
jgi:hypothetical protein